jgi:hypothetical protein
VLSFVDASSEMSDACGHLLDKFIPVVLSLRTSKTSGDIKYSFALYHQVPAYNVAIECSARRTLVMMVDVSATASCLLRPSFGVTVRPQNNHTAVIQDNNISPFVKRHLRH